VSALGKSAAVVPIQVQRQVIGLLLVVRKDEKPFDRAEQTLLEAVADYASISLVNARLFRALEQAAEAAKSGERRQNAVLESVRDSVSEELEAARKPIESLLSQENVGSLTEQQRQALESAQAALQRMARAAEKTIPPITPMMIKR
jgi:GAF domain-containing protein